MSAGSCGSPGATCGLARTRYAIQDVHWLQSSRRKNAASACKDVDVIVLDLQLKQGTGFGVMRALTTLQRKPAIIVLTNFDSQEYKQAEFAYGANHFLDKAHDFALLSAL